MSRSLICGACMTEYDADLYQPQCPHTERYPCRWTPPHDRTVEPCTLPIGHDGMHLCMGDYEALAREALREVESQWEENHFEHCAREWPHPAGKACMWPRPAVLLRPAARRLRADADVPSDVQREEAADERS